MDIGEKIKVALEARGMSQKELSERAHTTEASISRYINGERYPKWQIAKRIACVLDVSLDWLADRKTENSSEKPNNSTISKMEQVDEPQLTPNYCGTCKHREVSCGDLPCDVCQGYSNYEPQDEPHRDCFLCKWLGEVDVCGRCRNRNLFAEADTEPKPKDEPQTDCAWK